MTSRLLLTVLLVGLAQAPAAQETAASADSAVLSVGNREVVTFRTAFGARDASERAGSAAARIDALIDSGYTGPIRAQRFPYGYVISLGRYSLFTITPNDGDLTLIPFERRVVTAQENLSAALREYSEQRSLRHLLAAALLALLATVLFIVVLRAVRYVRAFLLRRLELPDVPEAQVIRDISSHGFTLLTADHLRLLARRVVDVLAWAAGLFVAYLWLAFVLTRFAYTRPWGETLGAYLTDTIRDLALGAVGAVPRLFTVVIIFVFARWVTRVVGSFFDAVGTGRVTVPWAHPDTAQATKRLVKLGIWVLAVVVAYPYIPGSDTVVFKGVSVLLGVIISLGSSGIVGQAMSGLTLMYSRALKPGDYVRVGEIEGTVTKLAMLSTKIRTTKREEITLPNAVMVATGVRNYTRLSEGEGVILHTNITIGYDVPWRQVEALLLLAVARTAEVADQPEPFVLKTDLADFYVEYQLNAYLTAPELRNRALSELHANILDAFNEHGVQILSPHYEGEPRSPAVVPKSRWYAPPADARGSGDD